MYAKDLIIKNINTLMTEKEVNQALLASRLNVSKSYVSMLLKGERNFSQKVITSVAKALDVEEDEITKSETVNSSEYEIHLRGKAESGFAKEALYDWMIDMDDFVRLNKYK